MLMTPDEGWQNFSQSDELVELVASSLVLEENQGIWQYYNFSACSSVWCSDETCGTNQLQIIFTSEDSKATIKSLGLELTNNASEFFKQLYRLKRTLKSRYNIQEI
ncbi:hypothetical protein [Aliikangiella maris]|uniref:Uncharacterized protein n=2 Tax=Aliikangiella maris TaxID=3162458 RepID=A0ABV3MQI6_9GAMM